jgi:hypothetical protein
VHGLSRILNHGVGGAGFRIDIDIANMRGKRDAGTVGNDLAAGDRSAGIALVGPEARKTSSRDITSLNG